MRTGFVNFSKLLILIGFIWGSLLAPMSYGSGDLDQALLCEDPLFKNQWALENRGQTIPIDLDANHTVEQKGKPGVDIGWINVEDQIAKNAAPTIVAVLDSGIDLKQPKLAGRIQPDGIDLLEGKSMTDIMGHGTHVSGIIAGITPSSVRILPIRVLSPLIKDYVYKHRLFPNYVADGIKYAVAHGASIINMSFGWPGIVDLPKVHDAVKEAFSHGVLIIAATGNDRKETPTYPCAYSGVICVGAESNNGEPAFFSDIGAEVDLMAPGDAVISTFPVSDDPNDPLRLQVESRILRQPGYERKSGTSQAAPFVAGLAAALRAIDPHMTLSELKARIFASAGISHTPEISHFGMVNFKRALAKPAEPVYLPSFKEIQLTLDEPEGKLYGSIPVECYGPCQTQRPTFTIASLDPSVSIEGSAWSPPGTLRFTAQFKLKSASDKIPFVIRNASDPAQIWRGKLQLARDWDQLRLKDLVIYPKLGLPLLRNFEGKSRALIKRVDDLFDRQELPEYFGVFQPGLVTLVRPVSSVNLAVLRIPEGETVSEVIKIDADRDGAPDYVVHSYFIGQGGNVRAAHFHFFRGRDFAPLYGANYSTWSIDPSIGASFFTPSLRFYNIPGSWTPFETGNSTPLPKTILVPSFLAEGSWPKEDSYGAFDARSQQVLNHYYYFEPRIEKSSIRLFPRTVDSASFYEGLRLRDHLGPNETVQLSSWLSPSSEGGGEGSLRVLVSEGEQFSQRYSCLSLTSPTAYRVIPLTVGETHLEGEAQPVHSTYDQGPSSWSGFFQGFDPNGTNGRLTWLNVGEERATFLDIQSLALSNPLVDVIGFGADEDHVSALIQSRYNLIAVRKGADGTAARSSVSIDHDSSFLNRDFKELITPVAFVSEDSPSSELGAYIDSTLLVGDHVGMAIWDARTGEFREKLRYSLRIPPNCQPLGAFVPRDQGAINYELLCDKGDNWEFFYLEP